VQDQTAYIGQKIQLGVMVREEKKLKITEIVEQTITVKFPRALKAVEVRPRGVSLARSPRGRAYRVVELPAGRKVTLGGTW